MEPRISTVTLFVSNVGEAVQFYRDGLDLPLDRHTDSGAVFDMGTFSLAVSPRDGPGGEGDEGLPAVVLTHRVETRAAVDAVLSEASTAGATIVGLGSEKRWGGYAGHFTDPDGYYWEVVTAKSSELAERTELPDIS